MKVQRNEVHREMRYIAIYLINQSLSQRPVRALCGVYKQLAHESNKANNERAGERERNCAKSSRPIRMKLSKPKHEDRMAFDRTLR